MSLNDERAILMSHLSGLKDRMRDLSLRIDGNLKATKALLATSAVKPIEQIDIEAAAVNLKEAVTLKEQRRQVIIDIKKIEQELA